MIELTFKQTQSELMVRAAATIIFNTLLRYDFPIVSLSSLTEHPQYGFTASASQDFLGVKLVRITDLQDGKISWDTVPYCQCEQPEKYLLRENDILFARTGATTGKTHLVKEAPAAVFASYLIRVRPKEDGCSDYLYYFFQSDVYWRQIIEEKEGSAQPNVNGQKLMNIDVPMVDNKTQVAISQFLEVVRARQDGSVKELPELPPPLNEQGRIVARIEELAAKVVEARGLRRQSVEEAKVLWASSAQKLVFELPNKDLQPLGDLVTVRGGGTPSRSNPVFWNGSIPWVCPKDMKILDIKDSIEHISEEATYCSSAKLMEPGCVLIVVRGMILAHTVPSAILRIPAAINQDMKALVPNENILSEYLCKILWAMNHLLHELVEKSTHDTRKLETAKLLNFKIPVPPLPEQHRIVASLDALQAKVDALKRLQTETAAELDALLPSILDKAFKGEL